MYDTTPEQWDQRFLDMAGLVAGWSHDPSSQIGAVFVDDRRRVLSTGYNGFPRRIENHPTRWNDRDVKYQFIVHGEQNAIYNATWNGVSLDGSTLYVHGLPVCSGCARGVIQVGTRRVVVRHPGVIPDKWSTEWMHSLALFNEAGVDVRVFKTHEGLTDLRRGI